MSLPEAYTVYALIASDGTPWYIGCTRNVKNRKHTHRFQNRGLVFRPLETFSSKAQARERERYLIQAWQPSLNVNHTQRWSLPRSTDFKRLHARLQASGAVI